MSKLKWNENISVVVSIDIIIKVMKSVISVSHLGPHLKLNTTLERQPDNYPRSKNSLGGRVGKGACGRHLNRIDW